MRSEPPERAERSFPLVWSSSYEVDIGSHVFPTTKYRRVLASLLEDGVVRENEILDPAPASWDLLALVHAPDYLEKIRDGALSPLEQMVLEVPFSPPLRDAFRICCGGTLLTAEKAMEGGVASHLGGGFHHAFSDHGEGFCLLNDVAVAVAALLERGAVERAAVVDLDVHHGNGTAAIFADEPRAFTFSMHQENNYPHPKPPGDLDVGLPDGIRDDGYLELLGKKLDRILDGHEPQLVLYLAGADPFVEDQLGGLFLSSAALEARDRMVLEGCASRGIPVATVLAGGYARREEDTVRIHRRTVELARVVWEGLD